MSRCACGQSGKNTHDILLFLLMAIAMVLAWRGNRRASVAVRSPWPRSCRWPGLNHHLTDPLSIWISDVEAAVRYRGALNAAGWPA